MTTRHDAPRARGPLMLILALAAALPACRGGADRAGRPLTPVRVQEVAEHRGAGGVRYSATIEPREQVLLAFKVAGYVETILERPGSDGRRRPAQAGDIVTRGTVLARVRSADYDAELSRAEAAGAAAKAARDQARIDLDRSTALYESRSLTKASLDAAKTALDADEAQLRAADAQRRQAANLVEDCSLKAPIDGVILDRKIEVGSLVGSGSPAFVLADLSSVKAVFGVPDLVLNSLTPGQTLALTADAVMGARFTGRVTSVSPSADQRSRVFDVEVTIPNPDRVLKAGMIATVHMDGAGPAAPTPSPASAVPVVPLSAIVRPPGSTQGYAVFAVEPDGDAFTARARRVTLGEVYGNLIEIGSGVKPGERVIVAGATLVTDGERVRVVP